MLGHRQNGLKCPGHPLSSLLFFSRILIAGGSILKVERLLGHLFPVDDHISAPNHDLANSHMSIAKSPNLNLLTLIRLLVLVGELGALGSTLVWRM